MNGDTDQLNAQSDANLDCVTSGGIRETSVVKHNDSQVTPLAKIKFGIAVIARKHGVDPAEIYKRNRFKEVQAARVEAICWVATNYPKLSYSRMGKIFKRDHSTIMHHLFAAGHPRRTERKEFNEYHAFARAMAAGNSTEE